MFGSNGKHLGSMLILALPLAAAPAMVLAGHDWQGYHWARTTPQFTLKLGDNLTTNEWRRALSAASIDWNSPELFGATFTPVVTAVRSGQSTANCGMVRGTTQVCNGRYGDNGWLGLASINVTGGNHITQGTAKMNDTYFTTSTYNNPNEKRHVMCQEIAHTFGLEHQSETGRSLNTCMDYFSNTGANAGSTRSTRPNKHDFDQLKSIYAHTDNSTSITAPTAPITSGVDISNDPMSWGQRISQSVGGRSSLYQRHNADGSITVTHVYWTKEATENCPSCDHRFELPGKR